MKKNTLKLIIFLGIVILFFVGIQKVSLIQKVGSLDRSKNELFENLNITRINVIEISKGPRSWKFVKENQKWYKPKAIEPGYHKNVQQVLYTFKDLEKDELASTNPEKKSVFNVTKEAAIQVALKNGEEQVAKLYIGKRGPDHLSTYVRKEGEDRVWLVKDVLSPIFRPDTWEAEEPASE